MITKNYKPKYVSVSHRNVRDTVKKHNRRARRIAKQALQSGNVRDWDRAEKKLTNWDFD